MWYAIPASHMHFESWRAWIYFRRSQRGLLCALQPSNLQAQSSSPFSFYQAGSCKRPPVSWGQVVVFSSRGGGTSSSTKLTYGQIGQSFSAHKIAPYANNQICNATASALYFSRPPSPPSQTESEVRKSNVLAVVRLCVVRRCKRLLAFAFA